jgi:DNA invertase Pin-like site-specific DNA recombinase
MVLVVGNCSSRLGQRLFGWFADSTMLRVKSRRTGWNRLQDMIDAKQVGAVFVANISRLSRQVVDFELFRLRAALHNTVLYIDGRFMNPADSNDTIVAQITAMVAQFENRKRAELMMQSRLAKAKRGEVVSKLPAGWIKAADGKYAYDPAIRDTIRMIIDTFSQTRSIPRTVKALAEAGIRISYKTRRHRIGFRRIACERVRFILTHPAYAGTYIYGISHSQAGKPVLGNDESSRTNPEKRWISTYNHHPAYMSQQQQEEIKSILLNDFSKRSYRAHCCRALTKGLLRCALCGEILEVSYPSKAYVFRCRRLVEHAEKPCLNFSSNDLEQCILRQVFKVLKAPPIDMLKAALKASRIKKQTRISRIESERERLAHEERSAQERADLTRGSLPRCSLRCIGKT